MKFHYAAHVEQMKLEGSVSVSHTLMAAFGPSRLEVRSFPKAQAVCLVDAILSRAFELQLLIEAASVPYKAGIGIVESKYLQNFPIYGCNASPCPVLATHQSSSVRSLYLWESGRVPVDVRQLSEDQVNALRWGLADIDKPLTPLGHAYSGIKYALCGSYTNYNQNEGIPSDIWISLMTFLAQTGENINSRVEAAGLLVWDLVNCPIHLGLGAGMSLEPFESQCDCQFCRDQQFPQITDLFGDSIHRWWTNEDGATDIDISSTRKLTKYRDLSAEIPDFDQVKANVVSALLHFEEVRRYADQCLTAWLPPNSSVVTTPGLVSLSLSWGVQRAWGGIDPNSMQLGKRAEYLNLSQYFRLMCNCQTPPLIRFRLYAENNVEPPVNIHNAKPRIGLRKTNQRRFKVIQITPLHPGMIYDTDPNLKSLLHTLDMIPTETKTNTYRTRNGYY